MELPFSHEAFLDVFGRYNTSLWPFELALWAATAWFGWTWVGRGRLDGRQPFALLAVHWLWSGLVYHGLYFVAINPAAIVFAAAFVLQGGFFAWLAWKRRGHLAPASESRGLVGLLLVAYGLLYPAVGLLAGLEYPRLPLFGVPCPTTLITAGVMWAAIGLPRIAFLVPLLWAVVGSSAAFTLGIRSDLPLLLAAALCAVALFRLRVARSAVMARSRA